jgi:cation diffusion facilitator CzcD-associated flavoprotein CzcO
MFSSPVQLWQILADTEPAGPLGETMTLTAVVGAGPYGLAAAAHLRAEGRGVRVFGRVMEAWTDKMPAGMFLKSTPSASDISAVPGFGLADYCRSRGIEPLVGHHPVPLDVFAGYGRWVAEHAVGGVESARVERIGRISAAGGTGGKGRNAAGFSLTLDTGERFTADRVILATGLTGLARIPDEFRPAVDAGLASHSSDPSLADPRRFAGKEVAVIGAGQSALEGAALLHEAGATVTVLARHGVRFSDRPADVDVQRAESLLKPESPLGPGLSHFAFSNAPGLYRHLPEKIRHHFVATVLGPSGSWWLRDRVQGVVPVLTGQRFGRVEPVGDRLAIESDGPGGASKLLVDHLVLATGYQVGPDAYASLDPEVREAVRRTGPSPLLDAGFQSSVPGLHFTGLPAAATFGPLLRFVAGTGVAGRRLSRACR